MAHRFSLKLLTALALAGCCELTPDQDTPAEADLACEPDELALAWVSESREFASSFHPATLEVAPGGALFISSGEVSRMVDGTPVALLTDSAVLDDEWTRGIDVDRETRVATIRAVSTGEVLRTIAPLEHPRGWFSTVTARPFEGRTILLDCAVEGATEEGRAIIRSIELEGGSEVRAPLELACGRETHVLPIDRSTVLVVGLRESGPMATEDEHSPAVAIARIDVLTGAATSVFAIPASPNATVQGTAPLIGTPDDQALVAVAASATEIALVGRDGWLRRLDAHTLEPTAEPIAVPLLSANGETFLPSVESPVAYSKDGTYLAHLESEDVIAIRDTETSLVVGRLSLPVEVDDGVARPMAIEFVRDGLLVATDRSTARFACDGEIEPIERPADELTMRATGPTTAVLGSRIPFTIEVDDVSLPVIRAVGIEGYGRGSFGPETLLSPPGEGTFDVEIIATDGIRTARETTRIEIVPSS